MARKVFISFLGINNYIETIYQFSNGEKSSPVRFVQEALILSECMNWTDEDKILIFCTKKAEEKNWFNNGHEKVNDEIERIGLEQRLKDNFAKFNIVEKVSIPEGFSEDEIWGIFNIVYGKLQAQDNVYFDVTHAFRSIPLFSTVLFNYSRFMIGTNVVSIKYGAIEKLGTYIEVKNMPIEERVAPIVDLTNIIRLQQFTDMANSLTSFGRVNKISQMLSEQNNSLNPFLEKMSKAVENFDNHLLSNDMLAIKGGRDIIEIKNNIKQVRKASIPDPIKKVIEKLDRELSGFVKENSNKNIEEAIRWTVKYKMLAQAYTLGLEYIKRLFVEKFSEKNPFCHKSASENRKDFQEYFSALCGISQKDIDSGNFKGSLSEHMDLTLEFLGLDLIQELRCYYSKLGKNRNTINHAKGDVTYNDLVNEFEDPYNKCVELLK
ncbi:MAG: TM1812 family CRISPR-associated protein [Paludibacteraceae bacterium]|nr:TM1812 family CRISPR-associated protein [Paludibacteraceae bacterium]